MPTQQHEIQRLMKECKVLRSHSCTSFIELDKYFQFMHLTILEKNNFINCNTKQISTEIFHRLFFKSFQKFSQFQAVRYYNYMLNVVHQYVNCAKHKSGIFQIVQNRQPRSKQYQVDIIKKGYFNNTQRIHYVQIDRKKSILLIKSQNNPYDLQINLQNYIVRQSGGNKKNNSKKQFIIHKAGADYTPQQVRFAMKDVYQFPQFFNYLWDFILQVHVRKLKQIIDKLSDGGSKKGYIQIVLMQTDQALNSQQSEREQLTKTSQQKSVNQFSYLDVKHPVSKISEDQYLKVAIKQIDPPGHFVWWSEWQKTQKGHLKNINFQYIGVQRSAVKKVIKSFMSMGSGQSDMPIQMFSNQSNLLQLARACKYFSYFFQNKKIECHSTQMRIIDGFAKTFCSIIGFLLIRNRMQKPIQPFLGQTYQGFIDGYPISVQEIGKNQSYILFQTQEIKLYGCLELKTGITGLNSILAGSQGYLTLQLKKENRPPKILFTLPMIQLSGLLYGDRLVQINDTSVIFEETTGTLCCLNWGKNKKAGKKYTSFCQRQDFVQGQILKLKEGKKFQIEQFIVNKQYIKQFTKQKSVQKVYGQVYGNWTQQIFYRSQQDEDSRSIYRIQHEKPGYLYHYNQPIPSDCRLRKDIKLLQSDKVTQAEKQRKKIGQVQLKQETMRIIQKRN